MVPKEAPYIWPCSGWPLVTTLYLSRWSRLVISMARGCSQGCQRRTWAARAARCSRPARARERPAWCCVAWRRSPGQVMARNGFTSRKFTAFHSQIRKTNDHNDLYSENARKRSINAGLAIYDFVHLLDTKPQNDTKRIRCSGIDSLSQTFAQICWYFCM